MSVIANHTFKFNQQFWVSESVDAIHIIQIFLFTKLEFLLEIFAHRKTE